MDALKEYKDKSKVFFDIKGCAFRSQDWYHGGVDELVYEVGLKWELENLGYTVLRQTEFPVYYRGVITNIRRRVDLVVQSKYIGNVILELKAVNFIEDKHRLQLHSYMRLTNTTYGMMINFSPKGIVYTEIWEYDSIKNTCYRITV